MYLFAANLKKDIGRAQKGSLPVVFLGGDCTDTSWREQLKKQFAGKATFLDPYEKNWKPEEDIYNELTGLVVADFIVFFRGGEGSEKEKHFLDAIGASDEYESFDNLGDVEVYLRNVLAPIAPEKVAVRLAMERLRNHPCL